MANTSVITTVSLPKLFTAVVRPKPMLHTHVSLAIVAQYLVREDQDLLASSDRTSAKITER